jgi:hypothetical protein
MTTDEFWNLIDVAWDASGDDLNQCADGLHTVLEPLEPDALVAFNAHFHDQLAKAYRWDLWGAAYLVNGGASDDGFVYFRAWLILQGQEIYEAALADPDSLADFCAEPGEEYECEGALYVCGDVYEQKTGSELQDSTGGYAEATQPAGRPWGEKDLPDLLPRLAAIHLET